MKNVHVFLLMGLLCLAQSQVFGLEQRYVRLYGPFPAHLGWLRVDSWPAGWLTWTNIPTNATFTVQTATSLDGESNWVDYIQVPTTNAATTNRIFDFNPPANMSFIPAGIFTMGDTFSEGSTNEQPAHAVYVSAFYMDRYEVSKALWDEVYAWATNNGYQFANSGSGKALTHPVQMINWYDMVKWSNARSEKKGLIPAYYTNEAQTVVFRSGQVDLDNACVKWNSGYRLPTEAEWEKAARGGLNERRFCWGNTISWARANYYAYPYGEGGVVYDINPTSGYHPAFATNGVPYTSPVGYFAVNGYGLCDMVGNVWEWCWDVFDENWYSSGGATQNDTRGSDGVYAFRVVRGGSCANGADVARCAFRTDLANAPWGANPLIGFRCARSP